MIQHEFNAQRGGGHFFLLIELKFQTLDSTVHLMSSNRTTKTRDDVDLGKEINFCKHFSFD